MNNLFIISNSDIQCPGRVDPIVEYNHSLEKLNFKFYTTLSEGTNWTSSGSTFGKTQTGVKGKKVNPVRLGIDHDFNETGYKVPFSSALEAIKKPVDDGKPFTVVTSNCAHSLSAILSRASFLKYGNPNTKIKLVINYDYHYDFGLFNSASVSKNEVDNGAWGSHHCGGLTNWTTIDGAKLIYAVFGVQAKDKGNVWYKTYTKMAEIKDGNKEFGEVVGTLVESNMKTAVDGPCDVYITIDRDVLNNGCTHFFKDVGSYNMSGVIEKLEVLLPALKTKATSMNICGFDVTGLPCLKAGGKPEENYKNAVNDINTLYDFITPYLS
ncbi:MAG: arginase family protein [Planctomycetota bacterium]|jgi:hypothetical protein